MALSNCTRTLFIGLFYIQCKWAFTHRSAQGSRFSQKIRLKVLRTVADVLQPTVGYKYGYLLTVCHLLLSKILGLIKKSFAIYILVLCGENQTFKLIKAGQYSCRIMTPPSIIDEFMMGEGNMSYVLPSPPSNPPYYPPYLSFSR